MVKHTQTIRRIKQSPEFETIGFVAVLVKQIITKESWNKYEN